MRTHRITAAALLTALAFVLAGGYWNAGALFSQREGEPFFFSDGKRIPLAIPRDQVGVLAQEELSPQQVQRLLNRFELKLIRAYPRNVLIFRLPRATSRAEIVKLARQIRRENKELIKQAGFVATPQGAAAPFIVTDEFVVQFKPRVDRNEVDSFAKRNDAEVVMANPFVKNQFLLRVREGARLDALDTANRARESDRVEYAHPNFVKVIFPRQFTPNDTLFNNQWHHNNTGQGGGTADADVDSPGAWGFTQGAAGTMIAVIDGGFDITHPDLMPNFSTNGGETAGNGVDDDGNGFADDINGWDFTGCDGAPGPGCGDNNPTGPDTTFGRHGTAVAGAAAARGNNALGVTGSCPNCSLLLIRLPDTDFAQGLTFGYAQQRAAQVVTNSWGFAVGTPCTTNLCGAINNAATAGAIIFFAMNTTGGGYFEDCQGVNPDISSLASVIAVSASNNRDQRTPSGYGNCMSVLAPTDSAGTTLGTLFATTTDMQGAAGYNNNATPRICPTAEAAPPPANARDYTGCFAGTSFATPLTAGVAGLLLSASPGLTRVQVQRLLQDTADRIEDSVALYDPNTGFSNPTTAPQAGLPVASTHGWGRINAFEAVRVIAPVAQGGRGGVDVLIRDNRLDWGNTEQPSNTLFEPTRSGIEHWVSVDVKVDAPPYQTAPTTSAQFDAFIHENAESGDLNKVYVRVRNRGTAAADTLTVKLHWAFAGTALPGLPGDFWSAFPADSTDTSVWHPLGVQTVSNLGYSGSSVASTGADGAQIVAFDFPGPGLDPTLPAFDHFCLFAVLDSPQDRALPKSRATIASDFVPDLLTPTDNNVTHRNIRVVDLSRGVRSFDGRFFVRNPTKGEVQSVLSFSAPKGWKVTLSTFGFNKPFRLRPNQQVPVRLRITTPSPESDGEVVVRQEIRLDRRRKIVGGLNFRFEHRKPDGYKPPKRSS